MTPETRLVLEIWDSVRDFIPNNKRFDVAEIILKAMVEYGMEPNDFAEVIDEDNDLAEVYELLYGDNVDDEEFDD